MVSTPEAQRAAGLEQRLERLGVVESVVEKRRLAPSGTRFFRIAFSLPVDHDRPEGRRFLLRATLLHRGSDRPMVLAASGYGVSTWAYGYQYEVTRIVRGNQLDLEHRFFNSSRPSRPNWSKQLRIRQAAADQHLIVRAMKRIYDRRWVSTGHSKGGMTMTYHRRFYPGDVNGTVAYVAPNDAVDDDDVYGEFQAGVAGRRTPTAGPTWSPCSGGSSRTGRGSRSRTWPTEVAHSPSSAGPTGRSRSQRSSSTSRSGSTRPPPRPATRARPRRHAGAGSGRWVDAVFGWYFVTDEGTRPYVPYYYQAATQLGAPAPYEDEVADLLLYPGHDVRGDVRARPARAADVRRGGDGRRGRLGAHLSVPDAVRVRRARPVECRALRLRDRRRRAGSATSGGPGGNHGSAIALLPDGALRAAIAQVRQWAGSPRAGQRSAADRRGRARAPARRSSSGACPRRLTD